MADIDWAQSRVTSRRAYGVLKVESPILHVINQGKLESIVTIKMLKNRIILHEKGSSLIWRPMTRQ